MTTVCLAFKAFDCHELLCHAIAQEAGLYEKSDLSVRLIDSTFLADESLPRNTFHAACGAALAGFLAGRSLRVVFVSCDRPMFWLHGRESTGGLADLAGARIATFADAAPPARFLQGILAAAGVRAELMPCRDDVARLGLLRSGSVDAALLSSLYLPGQVAADGLHTLAFVGDHLRLPSTGLAVSGELAETDAELVAAMVGTFAQAMELVFGDDRLLGRVLRDAFGVPPAHLRDAVATVRDCYNPAGFSEPPVLQAAVDRLAAAMEVNSRPAGELYDAAFLKSEN